MNLVKLLLSLPIVLTINYANSQDLKPTGELKVQIGEFRNTDGHLLISLFNTAADFPENKKGAYRTKKVKVSGKSEVITFTDLPYGEYALIFMHDENDNEEMNTNMMGIPQEGYGASNNAVNTFSAPKYQDAKFEVSQPLTKQVLKLYY